MIQVAALTQEKVWLDKFKYDQAEKKYYENLAKSQLQDALPSTNKQCQQQPSKKAQSTAKSDSKTPKNADKNKSNRAVKEPKAIPPPTVVAPVQSVEKIEENNESIDGTVSPKSLDLVENKINSTKSNKKVRTYKKEKDAKLPEGINSTTTPNAANPQESQDIITPGPTPIPSDPSLITSKAHKKKKSKKELQRNHSKESKVTNVNNSLASEVAKARNHIKTRLQYIDDNADIATTAAVDQVSVKVGALEKENKELKQKVASLTDLMAKMEIRLKKLETNKDNTQSTSSQATSSAAKNNDDDEDDGVDLFGSDSEEEDAEAARIREQRLAEYAAKKSKKPALIAKSNIILDVKPWSDESDMKELEKEVRKIEIDGLLWGASKLVPLAYGIHKLQISCVVEDDKVSVDDIQEKIEAIEEYVQSVDIAAFNKV